MRAHLDAETTRLGAIWRITRKDGQQFFFTDHDRDIVFGGDTYRADAGFERTAIRSDAGFAVDNLDLVGVFAEGGIVEDEVAPVCSTAPNQGLVRQLAGSRWPRRDQAAPSTLGETRLTPQGPCRAAGPVPAARAEHARGVQPELPGRPRRSALQALIQSPGQRDQAVRGRVLSGCHRSGTGSARYEDRIYEVIEAGTTAASQPTYDTTIGARSTTAPRP